MKQVFYLFIKIKMKHIINLKNQINMNKNSYIWTNYNFMTQKNMKKLKVKILLNYS